MEQGTLPLFSELNDMITSIGTRIHGAPRLNHLNVNSIKIQLHEFSRKCHYNRLN